VEAKGRKKKKKKTREEHGNGVVHGPPIFRNAFQCPRYASKSDVDFPS
jgi:hypothetical protein